MLISLLFPQTSAALKQEGSLRPMVPLVGKKSPGWTSSSLVLWVGTQTQEYYFRLVLWGYWGNLWDLTTGN